MATKEKVLGELEKLCYIYKIMPSKKFQLRAVQTATDNLKSYDGDIISGKDAAKKVKGVGKGMIRRIDEIIETGKLDEVAGASGAGGVSGASGASGSGGSEGEVPAKRAKTGEKGIIHVTGIGPVRAKKLIDDGIDDIDKLNVAVEEGKIKLTHHQKIGVKYYKDFLERIPRSEIIEMEKILKNTLSAVSGGVSSSGAYLLEVCGSYRREREDCGDIDVLMSYKGMKDFNPNFLKLYVKYLADSGFITDHLTINIKTKYMGVCCLGSKGLGRRIDIRAVPYNSFYPALIYFTGSKEFNIGIRKKALEKGYSLSEYGFKKVDSSEMLTFNSEEEIFDFLGMDFVSPCDR